MNILQQIAKLLGGKLTKVHEKTVANKEAIESEVTRAKASETLLDTNIKNETKRAQDEETRIELKAVDLVNAEETRAIAAEAALSTKIDTDVKAEADRAKGAEQAIIGNLNAETARAKAAEKVNSDAITGLDERKVDKVEGKQLSTEDYTTAEKSKLANVDTYVTTIGLSSFGDPDPTRVGIMYGKTDPATGSKSAGTVVFPLATDSRNGLISPSQKLVLDNLLSGDSALSILGTPSSTWQLNLGSGPKIKNSGGVFELRNAADTAYADLTVNALTIKGNVTQEGGSFITQAETVSAKDNTILLNSGETGAGVTKGEAGVEIDRGTLPKYKFIFDESDDRFKVGSEGDLWSVMLRDNESDLTNGGILTWDSTTKRAKTAFNIDDLADTYLPLAGGTMSGPIRIAPLTEGVNNGIQASPGTWSGDNSLLTYDASVVDFGPSNALLNIWGTEIAFNPTTATDIVFSTASSNNLVHKIQRKKYLIYDEHNLDISQFAKAAEYIPLAGNSENTPITGLLFLNDKSGMGIYGQTVTHLDGAPRHVGMTFDNNNYGGVVGKPDHSDSFATIGCSGESWYPNAISQIRVGYKDNAPLLIYRTNPNADGELHEYNIYHEGNLDVNSMVSGFLPLSAGMDKPLTGVLYASGFGGAGRRGINITSGTVTSSDSGIEFISREGVMGMGMVQDEGASIWVGTSQDDTHICATIDNSDRWTFPNGIYIQGSKGATLEDLSGYLPLSGGTMTSALKFTPMGSIAFLNTDNSIRALLGYGNLPTGKLGLILKATLENNIIAFNTPGDLFHQKGSSEYKIWTEGNDGAGSGLDADLLDGKQGSEYALKTDLSNIDLSGYLPLSAGSSKPLTGSLFAQGITNNGPNGFNLSIITGNSTVGSSGVECDCNGLSVGFGANNNGIAYFWVGGNSSSEKSYYASVSKASKSVDFLYRPSFGGDALAKLSEVPTNGSLFRYYTITVGGDSNHFYPCTWLNSSTTSYVSIHSRGAGGTDPYNQNQITFLASLNGWSDMPKNLRVLESNLYTYSEVTIHSIYAGNENGNNCIYLRGGLTYYVWSNISITPNVNGFTSGNESFGIMDSSYNVTTAYATKMWTYEKGVTVAYADRGAALYLADAGAPNTNNIQLAYSGTGLEPSQVTHILAYDNREIGTTKLARDFTIDKLKTRLGSLPANGGNADTVDGLHVMSSDLNTEASRIVRTNSNGYIMVGYINSNINVENPPIGNIIVTNTSDGYYRKASLAHLKSQLGSMPASDVYSWAKASSKPSYAWSEIGSKPTTLANRGITDGVTGVTVSGSGNAVTAASISGHTLTLTKGATYLTSHQSLANYVTLNTAQTISGAKTFTSFVICSAGAGTSSDIRLKKYVNRMFDAEEVLSNLSGYRYVMKETDMHYAGLIAQEVQEVLPEAVREDENGFLTVDTYPIVAALVEANKAKDNRIKSLEDRLSALEKKMNMILK